jgi:hypothetical protein
MRLDTAFQFFEAGWVVTVNEMFAEGLLATEDHRIDEGHEPIEFEERVL